MLSDHVIRRSVPAAIIAILLVLSASSVAEDGGVITLRLDEPGSSGKPSTDNTIVVPASQKNPAPLPEVKGASAVLMDANTGQILYSKNRHVRRPNASTTKIMTAILLIENCKMTDTIKASKNACETRYTSLHLKPGEKISAKDVLIGMMVRSANDAAVAAAEHIAGTTSKFAKMMNKKAREIKSD